MVEKPTYEELEKRVRELEQAAVDQHLFVKEQLMVSEVLKLIDETENLKDLLAGILSRMKEWSGCEAVGIRLKEGVDFPYFVTSGFPGRFVELERHLCSYDEDGDVERDKDGNPILECMCGNIISGRFDPSKNFFTMDGSFWSNSTTKLLQATTDADRQARTRNRCNSAGYESVALIPLRSAGETFGLIQLNDHRKGCFSPESIAAYRRIADYVAGFLAKRQARSALRKSEAHLRALLDTLPDLVWLKDPDGAYLSCNSRFESFFGSKETDIIGKTDYEFMPEELVDFFRRKDKEAMAAGIPCKNEEEVTFADDGHRELLETIKTPMYDSDGTLIGVLGIGRDITQRKQAEALLKESEERFRAIFDNAIDGILLSDVAEKRLHSGNRAFCRMLGYTHEEIRDLAYSDIHPKDALPAVMALPGEQLTQEISSSNDVPVLRKDGTIFYADINSSLVSLAGKKYWISVFRDVTQRKQAEEVRQYQEQLLLDMGRIAKIGGWEFDPATGKGSWTEEVARIHDLDPDSETSMELGLNFYHGESRARIENAIKAVIELGKPYDLELEMVSARGTRKWVHTIGKPKIENGKVVQVRGSFQDITVSKTAEQQIERLNRVLKTMIGINQLIVRERDPAALIRKGCRLLVDNRGYAAALIMRTDKHEKPVSWAIEGSMSSAELLEDLFKRGELPPCFDLIRHGEGLVLINDKRGFCGMCSVAVGCAGTPSLCVRLTHEAKNYGYLVVALNQDMSADDEERNLFNGLAKDLAYALSVIRSESKRKSLEEQLIQARKMESVGRLAGGVAHDYNNMLSIITGYTELALENAGPGSPLHADLSEVLKAAKHSRDITAQLLAFARKQTIAPRVLNLNDTVKITLNMLRRLIGEDIELAWLPGPELWPVKIDPSQVDQILTNLCVNARDAIAGVGKIIIETSNINLDAIYCAEHAGFIPGDYVMLAVSDDGSGMDKETQSHLFEPFFSTKENGKGTGLGLATVYGIAKQNNGFVNVYSETGRGTTFRIYLPRNVATVREAHKSVEVQADARGNETVLLVEDEPSILRMTQLTLERLGYTVLTANYPSDAIDIARENAGKIHLMITDVVMPEMNGRELSLKLHKTQPDMKVLFMSGYTSNAIAHRGVLDDNINFLQKPFSKKSLAAKVREVLDVGN